MQVTATPSQGQAMVLRVVVLTGAAAGQPGGTKAADTDVAPGFDQPVPVTAAGSLVYGAAYCAVPQGLTPAAGTTLLVTPAPEGPHVTFRSSVATTGPGAPSFGAHGMPQPGSYAAAEFLTAPGGSLAEDPSAPPVAAGALTADPEPVTTADFDPPAGSVLAALVVCGGYSPQAPGGLSADVSGGGLEWALAAWQSGGRAGAGSGGAGVFWAQA